MTEGHRGTQRGRGRKREKEGDRGRKRETEGDRGRQRESTRGVEESQWQSRQDITTHQCSHQTLGAITGE